MEIVGEDYREEERKVKVGSVEESSMSAWLLIDTLVGDNSLIRVKTMPVGQEGYTNSGLETHGRTVSGSICGIGRDLERKSQSMIGSLEMS